MDWVRGFEFSVAGLVVLVVLASGPLVGPLDFTRERDLSGLGEGNATVASVSVPETVYIDHGDYGSEAYYLEVPAATVELSSVTGRPILAYRLSIPALGYTRSTSHFLDAESTGRVTLQIEGMAFSKDRIQQRRYDGELQILLRGSGEERVVHDASVTVEVTE